ncbi:ABC transporter ATP-binding protein [Aeromicrobium choanae]|uniref:Amino acid/amide ABC transporter ATP-binding protein 2, HAAT family n=1 Tax=Aeromicrobium choanae TaxID=1736691 RepID=A0A1T4YX94_9ACTN|nr:ABC transporter ATP-binding protein [Aeromicrobium choanae]SKB06178.1 amino acid/amide ABC transporter ATP-binding protein 2, HAAT family [Aeromicrobium choanae]
MTEHLLELSDVHASIGVSHILQGVSFDVPAGDVTVIIGRNGVGKTTTLRAVLGLVERTGEIRYDGRRIDAMETSRIVREGIAYVPEDRDVFADLTVAENLALAERKGRPHRYDLVHDLFPELESRAKQRAGTLSGGQQQMVSLARGLLNESPLLLIDEPTKGLAPKVVSEVVKALELIKGTATVLMVEQNIAAARRLADHVVIMAEGRVVAQHPAAVLHDEATIREALGVGTTQGGH